MPSTRQPAVLSAGEDWTAASTMQHTKETCSMGQEGLQKQGSVDLMRLAAQLNLI